MSVLPWVVIFGLGALDAWLIASLWIDIPAIFKEWRRRRYVVRHSAADQEIRARRAAQQLSLMAWRARHEMYNLANQGRSARSVHLIRRDDE
jgi:hypothetical protein